MNQPVGAAPGTRSARGAEDAVAKADSGPHMITGPEDEAPPDALAPAEPARDAYREDASPFRSPARGSILHRLSPVSDQLPGYRAKTFRRDLLAGITVAAIALPSGIAYAGLAGVSPVAGLYALLLPTVVYAFLGSSRQLIVGPEGSITALIAAALLPLAASDPTRYASMAALLALLVGGIYLVARIIRLGWVADYFSRPVLTGYIHGVAIFLIIAQLGKLFGLEIAAQDPLPQLAEFAREIGQSNAPTIAVGVACLVPLLLLTRLMPRFPSALVVVGLAIAASAAFDLEARGVAIVGEIPSGLPGLALPTFRLGDVLDLLPAAIGIFLVGFADQILTARAFAGKHGQHVRAEQELVAMGFANIAAGVTHSFSIGASAARTAVNDETGGRTQLSGLTGALAVALVLLFLTGPMRYLPIATLGAVIVSAAVGLIDPNSWKALARTSRAELLIAVTTMLGVVLFGVLEALGVAVALSIVDVVRRSASPHDAVLGWVERLGRYADVRLHRHAKITPGVLVYRLDDRLFFANASYVSGRIREAIHGAPNPVRWFVFDAEALTHVDATGIHALKELIASLDRDRITFVIARLKAPMERAFEDAGVLELIGSDHVHPTVRSAVEAAHAVRKEA
jgi:sulfate permease, SulP family